MSEKHTPGPWKTWPSINNGRSYIVRGDYSSDSYGSIAYANAEADARLIAAAPDLLYALQEFLRNPGGDYTEEIAREAIAKATGCFEHSVGCTQLVEPPKIHRAGSFGE